eukprot:scaffold3724_cov123-Skeletonema_dohrnii-CCMP3373.AAC.12
MASTEELTAVSDGLISHLRRCSDADTDNQYLSRDKDREIRYGARVAHSTISKWASSGHLQRCSDADTTNQYLSRDKDTSLLSWPTMMGH